MPAGSSRFPTAVSAILVGGLIAGVLDITYACVFSYIRRGVTPATIFRSVAAGALGPSAREGGIKTAVLGLVFHFLIALIAAGVYYFASRVLPFMITHPVICGILYGLCVYVVMYGIVLRVSRIHVIAYPWSYPWPLLTGNVLIHTLGIGLTIALVVRKFSR
jgi:hypothetical protein